MSKLLALLCVSFALLGSQEQFERAQAYYVQGNYDQAYETYGAMDTQQPFVRYALGNCCYGRGQYQEACVWWLAACTGSCPSQRAACWHNIIVTCAQKKMVVPEIPWYAYVNYYTLKLKLVWWQILLLISLSGVCYGSVRKAWRHRWWYMFLLSMILAGVVVMSAWSELRRSNGYVKVVTHVYAGPCTAFHLFDTLKAYEKVKVMSQQGNGWCQISHKGLLGWVPQNTIIVL
jgi:tetratricopeptide (TPR) repeat protein